MNLSKLSAAGENSQQVDGTTPATAPVDAPGNIFAIAADIMRQWAEVQTTLPQSNPKAVEAVLSRAEHMDARAAGTPYDPAQ